MAQPNQTKRKVGALTEADLSLLLQAKSSLDNAQGIFQFVAKHLASVYGLRENQSIEANGDIVENSPEAAEDSQA